MVDLEGILLSEKKLDAKKKLLSCLTGVIFCKKAMT